MKTDFNERFVYLLSLCKCYLQLNVIYDVCLNFLSKSNNFLNEDRLDKYNQI